MNICNSLPVEVVEVDTIDILKNRLDKYWTNQEVTYAFNACLTGTGDLPICISMFDRQDVGTEEYLRQSELIGLDWIGRPALLTLFQSSLLSVAVGSHRNVPFRSCTPKIFSKGDRPFPYHTEGDHRLPHRTLPIRLHVTAHQLSSVTSCAPL